MKGGENSSVADASEKAGPGSQAPVGGAGGLYKNKKAGFNLSFQQKKRGEMNDADWEAKFELLFANDLIPVDNDFYEEELLFKDPNDLNKIFGELEEQNLYLINQSQELEESLDN